MTDLPASPSPTPPEAITMENLGNEVIQARVKEMFKSAPPDSVSGEGRKWPWRCSPELRALFWSDVQEAVAHAYRKHGDDQWGRHEFKAIMEEEYDEIWDAIKADLPQDELRAEIIQLACVCLRYLETGDRYRETYRPEPPDV